MLYWYKINSSELECRLRRMATIFIIEDDLALQKLYELMLKIKGFNVIGVANNGEIAVLMYESFTDKPDVILMDYRMPLKNGLEATKEILEIDKKRKSKVIFVSADKSIKEKAISMGAISFVKKPFSHERLVNEINNALRISNLPSVV